MRFLLTANIFDLGSTSLFVLRALNYLGHDVRIWDPKIQEKPPESDYDVFLNWTNSDVDIENIKAKKKVLYYLEDPIFLHQHGEEVKLYTQKDEYDFLFTMNKIPNFEKNWLPMGCSPYIHQKTNEEKVPNQALFIGTKRDKRREEFIYLLSSKLSDEDIPLLIVGNNWQDWINWSGGASYFKDFNHIVNKHKVIINIHQGSEISPSDKVHAIIGCGGALLLNDDLEGYKECYPMAPTWKNLDHCIELVKYYLEHSEERENLVKQMQEKAYKDFSYIKQLWKIVEIIQKTDTNIK